MASSSPDQITSPQTEFWAGCRQIIPLVLGAIPFGLIFGTLATASGLSLGATIAMSAFVFAGSSQFVTIGLVSAGTAIPLIILTTVVVNLRHLLYAVSLVPHIGRLPQGWKLLLGFWLTDEVFAVAIARYTQPDSSPYKPWYQLGASLLMYTNWLLFTLLGVTIGNAIPDISRWGLDFAMSVTFIGMILPYLTKHPMIIATLVAGITSVLAYGLPHQLGLIVATAVGLVVGVGTEKWKIRPSP